MELLKTWSGLYPDYQTFEDKVITPIRNKINNPIWMDDSKVYFKMEAVYYFLANKYALFGAVNLDDTQHGLMQNAMVQLLPTLYTKSLQISNDTLQNLSIDQLLKNVERRFNEDADNKYASTETAYSSTPDDSQKSGTFEVNDTREKNLILRKDGSVRVRELSNLIDKFNALGNIQASGVIIDFINSIEISSLWEYYDTDYVYGVKGLDGKDGVDGQKGDTGDKGDKGDKGDTGSQGNQGIQGDKGDDGNSFNYLGSVKSVGDLPAGNKDDAWEVLDDTKLYIFNGAAWVATGAIQGPQGPQGNQGDQGDKGDKGDAGDTGVIVWDDITSTYQTRDWTNDTGKEVRITYGNAGSTVVRGVGSSFIQQYANLTSCDFVEVVSKTIKYSMQWSMKNTGGGEDPNGYKPNEVGEQLIEFGDGVTVPSNGYVQHDPNKQSPFPILKFEISSVAPPQQVATKAQGELADQMGSVAFSGNRTLSDIDDSGTDENTIASVKDVKDSSSTIPKPIKHLLTSLDNVDIESIYERGDVITYFNSTVNIYGPISKINGNYYCGNSTISKSLSLTVIAMETILYK